jgi:RNA recognition motif-containing protein
MASGELKNVVWVNKLPKNVTEEQVRTHFKGCGQMKNVFVCSSRNRNMTYCFVEFSTKTGTEKALKMDGCTYGDGTLTVALADVRLYERSVRRTEERDRIRQMVEEEIKDMSKLDAYYYGFSQGKKNILRKVTRPRRVGRQRNLVQD